MSIDIVDKQVIKEIFEEKAKIATASLAAMGAIERWIPRKAYAKYYGLSHSSIHNRTKFLRKKGVVRGERKTMRYDKFFNPITNEYTIPEGTQTI
jgi:DNA-binding Lrp family transcriptional regulator